MLPGSGGALAVSLGAAVVPALLPSPLMPSDALVVLRRGGLRGFGLSGRAFVELPAGLECSPILSTIPARWSMTLSSSSLLIRSTMAPGSVAASPLCSALGVLLLPASGMGLSFSAVLLR